MLQTGILLSLVSLVWGGIILPTQNGVGSRIVGGVETTIDKYPYQVSMVYESEHICGGSIINERTILTAAHCTDERIASLMAVRAGTSFSENKLDPGVVYGVEKFIQHANFNLKTVDFDIAILKLKTAITYTSKIQPIPLQASGVDVPINNLVTVTGWGATFESDTGSEVLRMVEVNTISTEQCIRNYGGRITENMFCTQTLNKDACQGDSGGPVTFNGHLVGIVSWGKGCANPQYPGVFTRIAHLRPWIDQNMNA